MSRIAELLERKREDVAARKSRGSTGAPPGDRRVHWARDSFRIIAEIKRSSPSAGAIRPGLDPVSLAASYQRSGAAAISVLTEEHYFGGSLEDLRRISAASAVPVLQKDFVLDPFQVEEAKAHGASFVLLIVRFLERSQLRELQDACRALQLSAIVEITDLADLQKLEQPVEFLGVNSRNLETLEIDTTKFETMRRHLPDAFLIAESGIRDTEILRRVIDAGYDGALIGEHLLRAADPAQELAEFVDLARMPVRVKICGITTEKDAGLAIEAGADALGFIFAESPRRVDAEALAAMRGAIPASVLCVGVFRGQTQPEVAAAMQRFDLDVAQVYDAVDVALPVWKVGGTFHDIKADEALLPELWRKLPHPVFAIAGGLHAGNVARAVEICRPQWVDVARGVEREPGVKDPAKLREFMRAVR